MAARSKTAKSKKADPAPQTMDLETVIREVSKQVVKELKPEIEKKVTSVRNDLAADVAEKVKAINIQPATAPAPAGAPAGLSQLVDSLKGGNIDLSQIGSILGQIRPAAPSMPMGSDGKPLDLDTLTPGQIKYIEMQEKQSSMSMMMQLLPALLGQGQQNPLFGEMIQRIFMEKIYSSIYMDRAMMTGMAKMFGAKVPPDPGLTTPITDQIAKMGPVGAPAKEEEKKDG